MPERRRTVQANWMFCTSKLKSSTEVCDLGVVVGLMHRWPGRFF